MVNFARPVFSIVVRSIPVTFHCQTSERSAPQLERYVATFLFKKILCGARHKTENWGKNIFLLKSSNLVSTMLEPRLTPSKENSILVNKVHSKRAQWYSPCKNSPKILLSPEPDAPTLKLTHFATIPKISFGTVKVGSSQTETFVVFNPHPTSQNLEVVKCPTDKGFTLDLNDIDSKENSEPNFVSIPSNDEMYFSVKWEPKVSGSCREVIRFKWENSPSLQIVVFGTALEPKKARSVSKFNFKKSQINKVR